MGPPDPSSFCANDPTENCSCCTHPGKDIYASGLYLPCCDKSEPIHDGTRLVCVNNCASTAHTLPGDQNTDKQVSCAEFVKEDLIDGKENAGIIEGNTDAVHRGCCPELITRVGFMDEYYTKSDWCKNNCKELCADLCKDDDFVKRTMSTKYKNYNPYCNPDGSVRTPCGYPK